MESVVYAVFDIFLTEIEENAEYIISKQIKTPVEHIKAGEFPEEAESILQHIWEDEYTAVNY